MKEVVIVSGVRTAQGKFSGALKRFSAPQLGSIVIREAVNRAILKPKDIDEVIMGNVVPAGLGQNVARQAAIAAGIPYEVGSFHSSVSTAFSNVSGRCWWRTRPWPCTCIGSPRRRRIMLPGMQTRRR